MKRRIIAAFFCVSSLWFALGCDDDDSEENVTVGGSTDSNNDATAAGPCVSDLRVQRTPAGVEYVRTPDSCFEGLPDWKFEPRYVEIDGLRQHYIDEGPADAPPILLLHGQPVWSYLYRSMIPDLVAAGHRVIAMDHVGMGHSDKPIAQEFYSFQGHVERLQRFIESLDLRKTTLFCQDWGSIVGLWAASLDLSLFDRIVVGNGGIPVVNELATFLTRNVEESNDEFDRTLGSIPENQVPFFDDDGNSLLPTSDDDDSPDAFSQWMTYAFTYEEFRVSKMAEALTFFALDPEEESAYDAPFPGRVAMMAVRTFPSLRNQLQGLSEARLEALKQYSRPFLTVFGGNDPGLSGEGDGQQWMIDNILGASGKPHVRLPEASHFLQDDQGPEIARRVNEFISMNP